MSKKSIVLVLLILHLCEQRSPWGLAEESWSIILISAAMQKYSCSWWACARPSHTHRLLFDFWRFLLELFLAAGYKTEPRRLKNMKEQSLLWEEGIFHLFSGGEKNASLPEMADIFVPTLIVTASKQWWWRIYFRHTFSSLFPEWHRQFRRQENLSETWKLIMHKSHLRPLQHKSACTSFRQVLTNNSPERCFWTSALGLCSLTSLGVRGWRISTFYKSGSLVPAESVYLAGHLEWWFCVSHICSWSGKQSLDCASRKSKRRRTAMFHLATTCPWDFWSCCSHHLQHKRKCWGASFRGWNVHHQEASPGVCAAPQMCWSRGCAVTLPGDTLDGLSCPVLRCWIPTTFPHSWRVICVELSLGNRAVLPSLREGNLTTS